MEKIMRLILEDDNKNINIIRKSNKSTFVPKNK